MNLDLAERLIMISCMRRIHVVKDFFQIHLVISREKEILNNRLRLEDLFVKKTVE